MSLVIRNQLRRCHAVCINLHDYLVGVIRYGEQHKAFFVKCKLNDPAHVAEMDGLKGERLWEWLSENGYEHVVAEMTRKQCFAALVSDSCHFFLESLRACSKGKVAVAYTLLRKPVKDNLFYLEWMLSDFSGFLSSFNSGGRMVDVGNVSTDRKLQIMSSALSLTASGKWIDPKFLCEIRYEKDCQWGLERLWNQATHLITTCKAYPTPNGNFNFLFANEEEQTDLREHYYQLVTPILFHFCEVVDALLVALGLIADDERAIRHTLHTIELLRSLNGQGSTIREEFWAEIQTAYASLSCPACEKSPRASRRDVRRSISRQVFRCRGCGYECPLPSSAEACKPGHEERGSDGNENL